jgi:hypothetical protein
MGGHGLDYQAHDRDRWQALVNAVINLQVPQNAGNFLTSRGPDSFSRRTLLLGGSKHVVFFFFTYDG